MQRNPINSNTLVFISMALILLVFSILRLALYGPLLVSIGTPDTSSYISSARIDLLSLASFTARRPFTMNILYRFFAENTETDSLVISQPGENAVLERVDQRDFRGLVLFQTLLSIAGWGVLAWVIAKRMKHPGLKIFSMILILAFAFTPQLADWDTVLMSESLTLSLGALAVAIQIEIIFVLIKNEFDCTQPAILVLLALEAILLFFWVFIRDANLYVIPVTAFLTLLLIFKAGTKLFPIIFFVYIMGLFIFAQWTARVSQRWEPSLNHVIQNWIWPEDSGRAYFLESGMPRAQPWSLAYEMWVAKNGYGVYERFLLTHPTFVVGKLYSDLDFLFAYDLQPYYLAADVAGRANLIPLGLLLHSRSSTTVLIGFIFLAGILMNVVNNRMDQALHAWLWIGIWLYASAALTFFVSYFSDTGGLSRHMLLSITMFRLFMWLYLLITMDLILTKKVTPVHA